MQWKLKSPNLFPANWHAIVTKGPGEYYLCYEVSAGAAQGKVDRFRYFRFCLRAFPGFAASQAEKEFHLKTSIRRNDEGYYEIWIVVKPRINFNVLREVLIE